VVIMSLRMESRNDQGDVIEIREVIDHSKDPQTLGSTVGSWFEDAFSSYGGVCKVTFKIDLK